MLKSELVVSEDLNVLESHLKYYSARFIPGIFSDEGDSGLEGYKKERSYVLSVFSNQATVREILIPQMMGERDLFPKVQDILMKKELDIDPVTINNIANQIEAITGIIEHCCIATGISKEKIDSYYEESLLLIVYFNAVRSYIAAIKNMRDKFGLDNLACALYFSHQAGTSLSIAQQKSVILFVEKILTCFFENYLDIITVELDTGSPKLECSIRVNVEAKMTWDITKFFSDFFKSVIGENKADSLRALKKILEQLNKSQDREIRQLKSVKGELTQDEYEKRLLVIFDSYSELRKNQIAVAADNTSITKRLEGKMPLLIEDSGAPLPEMS